MCLGRNGEKMKTKCSLPKLRAESYVHGPCMQVLNKCRYLSRVHIMSMFRMLDCGNNFKMAHGGINCRVCKVTDDESHRINDCIKYKDKNLFSSSLKIDFETVYSENSDAVSRVIQVVSSLWDLKNGKNAMAQ